MYKKITRWLLTGILALLSACAVITVNVNFPEKDVRQAYKSLDEMLLKQGGDAKSPVEGQPAAEKPAGSEEKKEEVKPQTRLDAAPFDLSFVAAAHAAESLVDDLKTEMSAMPEVLKAYEEIKAQLPKITPLRESGAVGENKQGLLTIRDKSKLGGGDEALVKAANDSRKIVITGMAKALLNIYKRKQPGSTFKLNQFMPKAATTFADTRHEKAKAGWWIEKPDGTWVQK